MRYLKQRKMNQAGFSLVELIIVVAVIAVLVGILAPKYLKYVERTRRVIDVKNAKEMNDAILRASALYDPGTGVTNTDGGDLDYTYAVAWNKNTKVSANPPENIIHYAVLDFGEYPISKVYPDYYWMVYYDTQLGEVESIYLGKYPGQNLYQLYPDGSAYINM